MSRTGTTESAARERVGRVERALEVIESLPPEPRRAATDAVAALIDLYGEGWSRALSLLEEEFPGSTGALTADELVGHLLMVHGLHPMDVEGRVRAALDEMSAAMDDEAVGIELLEIEEGVARLRFGRDGHAPGDGVRDLVERVVLGAAPELDGVRIDAPAAGGTGPALVQLQGPRSSKETSSAAGAAPPDGGRPQA